MPDGDKLYRLLPWSWRRVYRLASDVAPAYEVGNELVYALADRLRDSGGLPRLHDLAAVVDSVRVGNTPVDVAVRRLTDLERGCGNDVNVRIAVREALRAVLAPAAMMEGESSTTHMLAQAFCAGLVEHEFFGRVRPTLAGNRFGDAESTMSWQAACQVAMAPRLSKLANNLVANPAALGLRAPRWTHRDKRSTSELLHDADLLAGAEGTHA